MATSAKQIAANRRKAKKSSGPRSPEGKAVSSRNAITHGLHACDVIIKSTHLTEDRSQYEHRQLTRAYRLLNHLQLMQASQSPPNLLSELKNTQNEPISTPPGHTQKGQPRDVCRPQDTSPFDSAQGDVMCVRSARNTA